MHDVDKGVVYETDTAVKYEVYKSVAQEIGTVMAHKMN